MNTNRLAIAMAALCLSWACLPLLADEPAKKEDPQPSPVEARLPPFTVREGSIVAGGGPLARLSYVGPINSHDFKNFELKIEVRAKPGSNGGVFFHTGPQSQFLKKGYEAQVCNSCGDKRKTG